MTSKRIIATAFLTSKINPALTLDLPRGPVQSYYEWLVQNFPRSISQQRYDLQVMACARESYVKAF